MTIEDRLKKIGDCDIKIIKSEIVKDAKLVIFKFDEFDTSAAIIYNTGELFHLKDWQGGVPATQKDIEEFDWLSGWKRGSPWSYHLFSPIVEIEVMSR